MRYTLLLAVMVFAFYGCSSTSSGKSAKGKYVTESVDGIIDEEYDLIIAPKYESAAETRYEEQIKVKPVAKSVAKKQKPATKPKATKVSGS